MPEYIAVIDRGGLDTATEWPGEKGTAKQLPNKTALKGALIINSFETGKAAEKEDINNPPRTAKRIQARLVSGITAVGDKTAQALRMMQLRAGIHSSNDYIMIRAKMPESEFIKTRKKDPYSGALDIMMKATTILHGNKEDFNKWMRRMQSERELARE